MGIVSKEVLGKRLAHALVETKEREMDFATRVGVTRAYLGRILEGRHEPSYRVLGLIANGLGISQDLLTSEGTTDDQLMAAVRGDTTEGRRDTLFEPEVEEGVKRVLRPGARYYLHLITKDRAGQTYVCTARDGKLLFADREGRRDGVTVIFSDDGAFLPPGGRRGG